MRTPRRPTYWMDAFPDHAEETLTIPDLEAFAEIPGRRRELAQRAHVRVVRLRTTRMARQMRLTIKDLLAQAPNEPWNLYKSNYAALVWESDDAHRNPIGFMTFTVSIMDEDEPLPPGAPISDVSFSSELIFVRPDRRGLGFGRYLSVGIINWLHYCRVRPPRCAGAGVKVFYHADFDSEGGAVCSQIITDHFQCMLDQRRDFAPDKLPWLISSFTENAGY